MARPKVAILSTNLIRDHALAIIDAEGLEALTMRRLASRLGVQAASLYSHFVNKDAVLDAIANRLAKSIEPNDFDDSWQVGLRTWAQSYYDIVRLHPNAAPIVAAGARTRSDYLQMSDRIHGGLLRHGWPPRHATMVAASTKYLVLGAATTAFDNRAPGSPPLEPGSEVVEHDSFVMALEGLIRGLEKVYATVVVDRASDTRAGREG